MNDKTTLQQKVKVLQKLFESNIKTEKELQSLDIEKILSIPGISVQDIKIIADIQKNIKANKFFSYLGGGDTEEMTKE